MLNSNNIVSRSKQLIESKFPEWDAATLNIFDTYLSRINPLEPETAEVVFTKREYENLLGVSEIRPTQLNNCIRKFMGNTVALEVKDENGKHRGWKNYCLFDTTDFLKNDVGEWEVTLRCHPKLQNLFFELKESGYQKYKLQYALKLKSKASKLLYYLLKDNQYKGIWIIEIPELRERLGATDKSYEKFKEFNRTVLQKAKQEINKNTDIEFSYEKVMKGRLTRAVKFIIDPSKENKQLQGQSLAEVGLDEKECELESMNEQPIINDVERSYNFWTEACDGEFNQAQMEELVVLAREHVTAPEQSEKYEMEIYHYLERKYKALNAKGQSEIKNRYGYLKWLVENENRQEKEKTNKKETAKKNRFNNFPQRTYDYDELERMLLTTTID